MTDLERLAGALANEHVDTLLGREELEPEVYQAMTRAVLRELREPSEAMIEAGCRGIDEAFDGTKDVTFEASMKVALQAVCDSILGEGEGDAQ